MQDLKAFFDYNDIVSMARRYNEIHVQFFSSRLG